jgi:hypothetical protein
VRVKQVFRVVINLLFLCYLLICLCEQVFDSLFAGARIYVFLTEFLTELFLAIIKRFVSARGIARSVSCCQWRERIARLKMVCLPGVIHASAVTTNVADDCGLPDKCRALAVIAVVVILFMFCPLYVA